MLGDRDRRRADERCIAGGVGRRLVEGRRVLLVPDLPGANRLWGDLRVRAPEGAGRPVLVDELSGELRKRVEGLWRAGCEGGAGRRAGATVEILGNPIRCPVQRRKDADPALGRLQHHRVDGHEVALARLRGRVQGRPWDQQADRPHVPLRHPIEVGLTQETLRDDAEEVARRARYAGLVTAVAGLSTAGSQQSQGEDACGEDRGHQ
jgi:hypothetical protein